MEDYYRYYRVAETPSTGDTFPRPKGNMPVAFLNYHEQRPVEGGAFSAWGELWYMEPLSSETATRFGLRPSAENTRPPIAAQMEAADTMTRQTQAHKKSVPDLGDR